ncbi:superoxide dismutase family protein [Propylenella binzhouense]|uniref:Superoxide dismutase family protein n=1 Tax=Propylenella binzhouense TaxID=2555902 RepID=A0A964WTN1_9HYPH|nr:superoxide dismutase family protein [Propylenella binzhouense]MYZ48169.1 superoxide dismutase family protein [Propylenella binzhouense]
MILRISLAAAAAALLVSQPAAAQQGGAAEALVAKAAMKDADGKDHGTVTLTQTPSGVLVHAELTGLTPGPHGFHFHAVGECTPPFQSAGGHYNPDEAKHGFVSEDGPHAGDMPNIFADGSGNATADVLTAFVSLDENDENSLFDEDGTAIMVHSGPDDYRTDPAGGSGNRMLCGLVE